MGTTVTRLLWFTWAACIGGAAAAILLGWFVMAFVLIAGALWSGLKAGDR